MQRAARSLLVAFLIAGVPARDRTGFYHSAIAQGIRPDSVSGSDPAWSPHEIYDGDFEIVDEVVATLGIGHAGWRFHGGGKAGTAIPWSSADPPAGSTYYLTLFVGLSNESLTHNRLYIDESAGAITFYSALVFLAVGLIAAPFSWTRPTPIGMLLMAATGLLAGSAQYCLIEAFRIASPSLVAPFEYTSLLWAMLFGFLVWGDVPTVLVLASAAVVIVSGIYVVRDEKAAQRRDREAPDPLVSSPDS